MADSPLFLECAEAQLEELVGSQSDFVKAQQGFQAEQVAFSEALAAFAPGLGAGKFLNAAFGRTWQLQAMRGAVEMSLME